MPSKALALLEALVISPNTPLPVADVVAYTALWLLVPSRDLALDRVAQGRGAQPRTSLREPEDPGPAAGGGALEARTGRVGRAVATLHRRIGDRVVVLGHQQGGPDSAGDEVGLQGTDVVVAAEPGVRSRGRVSAGDRQRGAGDGRRAEVPQQSASIDLVRHAPLWHARSAP